jgi:hypothetical protein
MVDRTFNLTGLPCTKFTRNMKGKDLSLPNFVLCLNSFLDQSFAPKYVLQIISIVGFVLIRALRGVVPAFCCR